MRLEAGSVYIYRKVLYLAVSGDKVIYVQGTQVIEKTPGIKFKLLRCYSVEDLCRSWNISLAELDKISMVYFKPLANPTKPSRSRRIDYVYRSHAYGGKER